MMMMMSITTKTLKNLSCDVIRENWNSYHDILTLENPFYEFVWETWGEKFNISLQDKYVVFIRGFIENAENASIDEYDNIDKNTIIVKNVSSLDRTTIHYICNKLGLKHETLKSKKIQKYIKDVKIQKDPYVEWCWEFTYTPSLHMNTEIQDCKNVKDVGVGSNEKPSSFSFAYCVDCFYNAQLQPVNEGLQSSNPYHRQSICEECLYLCDIPDDEDKQIIRLRRKLLCKRSRTF